MIHKLIDNYHSRHEDQPDHLRPWAVTSKEYVNTALYDKSNNDVRREPTNWHAMKFNPLLHRVKNVICNREGNIYPFIYKFNTIGNCYY